MGASKRKHKQYVIVSEARKRASFQPGDKRLSKLTEKDVQDIVTLYYTSDLSQADIARRYNVCNGTISAIICRRTWKWMQLDIPSKH